MWDNDRPQRLAGSSDRFPNGNRGHTGTHCRGCSSSWPPKKGGSKCPCDIVGSGNDYSGDIDDWSLANKRTRSDDSSSAAIIYW